MSANRIETEAIVVAYAMSRLDGEYLRRKGFGSWKAAYREAEMALGVPGTSFKNLRDEFDPFMPNARMGWHQRELRANRQIVMADLCDSSDDAVFELASRIVARDTETTDEAIDSLLPANRVAHNVAERLLTGKRAEDFFLENCDILVRIPRSEIVDMRNSARGYDFGVVERPEVAIEVKGLKETKGEIQFTDREWTEAGTRGPLYWLVVVGNLAAVPRGRVVHDPHASLTVTCKYRRTVTAGWHSTFSV